MRSLVKLTGTQTRQEQPGWRLSISMAAHHRDKEIARGAGAQLVGCLPRIRKAVSSAPAPHNLDMVVHICNPALGNFAGYLQLPKAVEVEASLAEIL